MKHKVLFAMLFASLIGLQCNAQTIFSAVSPSGHTLYYRVVDAANNYVKLTFPNDHLIDEGYDFNSESATAAALWGTGSYPMGNLVLPETVNHDGVDYTVKFIERSTFQRCPITSLVMGNTIDSICDRAFWQCRGLSNVSFSSSLRYVGTMSFNECFLGNVTLPASTRVLDDLCFCGAHIINMTLNEGLEVMRWSCIEGNLFDSIYIPASVREMSAPIFYADNVTRVVVDPDNPYFDSRNDCNAIINSLTGDLVKAVSTSTIPEGVTRIGDAFRGCHFQTLVLPSTVTELNFYDCHVDKLVIKSPLLLVNSGFEYVDELQVILGTPPAVYINTDANPNAYSKPVSVPCDAVADYQSASVWRNFTNYTVFFPYNATASGDEHGFVQVTQPTCANQTAMYTAYPAAGYHFVQWNDGVYNNPRTVAVASDTSLAASFALTDTVHVTITSGENYHGHSTAGVYLDTVAGNIVRSLVGMNINRPMTDCTVQVLSNIPTMWTSSGVVSMPTELSVAVEPGTQRNIYFFNSDLDQLATTGENMIAGGDFENGNIGRFITDYATPDSPGSAYRTYGHQGGTGVDGSNCIYFDGSTIADQTVISVTLPTTPGTAYRFTYMVRNTGGSNPPYFGVKINGVSQVITDVVPQDGNVWTTFSREFVAPTSTTTIEIVDHCLQGDGNDFYIDNIALHELVPPADAEYITITNTHGLVYDTTSVTIAEGASYHGHTLAGVYQDTIPGAYTDSIVYSRVSMTINRPMDSCMVQINTPAGYEWIAKGSNVAIEGNTVEVPPASSITLIRQQAGSIDGNLMVNGDFDFLDTVNIHYPVMKYWPLPNNLWDWGNIGRGAYRISEILGENCLEFMWATGEDTILTTTVDVEPNTIYEISFIYVTSNDNEFNYEELFVDGEYIGGHSVREQHSQAFTSWDQLHPNSYFINSGDRTQMTVTLKFNPVGCCYYTFIDKFTIRPVSDDDMITITNTHGLVRDTVDVTIAEGQSYRGHTLAGVYQDTIIGAATDSIVRSRVSMTVDRPMDSCIVTLGGNQGGTYFNDGEFYAADRAEVQVLPSDSKTLLYTPETLGVNLLTFGDEDYSNYNLYCGDYYISPDCSAYGDWMDRGVDGSTAIYFRGSCDVGLAFFRTTLNTRAGEQYLLRYMATAGGNPERPILALKVNGVQASQIDTLENCCMEPMWGTFEHLITATTDTTTIELVNLQGWDTQYWTSGIYHNEWFMDNFRLMKVYSTPTDSITITNTHGLIYDTVDVTIAEGESYHNHTLAGVYQDTIIGAETDSIVYARVSIDINHSYGNGTVSVSTDQEGRLWMGLDDDVVSLLPEITVQVEPATEQRYVLTSLADGSNMQPNSDFEQGYNYFGTEYSWSDIPFQSSHHFTICDTCGRIGKGMAVKGSQLMNRCVSDTYWAHLIAGHRYSFSYWAKSRPTNPAELAVKTYSSWNGQYTDLPGTDDLSEAIDQWKRYEHVFTVSNTADMYVRLVNLNTSADGNEFFLDDISLVDLTEATDVYRDTVIVRNTHQLRHATVDVYIEDGEDYHGHTLAGIYNDTITYVDYDSITTSRVSYVLNASGEGSTTLASNIECTWVDLDNGTFYNGDSISVGPMEVRHFGQLVQVQDTNLVVNGDFNMGNTGFTSYYTYLPLPYSLDDNTFCIGGYRIAQSGENSYFQALYNHANNGPAYTTTVSVEPNSWYLLSYKAVSDVCYTDQGNVGPHFRVDINGSEIADERFFCSYNNDFYSITNCGDIVFSDNHYHMVYSNDTVMSISLRHANEDYWGWYHFAYDDITLIPLTVSDTVTITNCHQVVYTTVDTTINEGESYNGYSLAGVYIDTTYLVDYDSITTSRISKVINSLDGNVSLSSNNLGWWKDINGNVLSQSSSFTTQVLPMQSSQFIFDRQVAIGNILVNGDFEQGTVGFTSQYYYFDGCLCCGPNNYAVLSNLGVDGSNCLSFDGSETAGTVLYEQTVQAISGATYHFSYMATTNGQDNSNPAYFEVLVNGAPVGNWDSITSNYPVWNTFDHTFVAGSGTLTLRIIDRNTDVSGNDCLIDELELTAIGGTNLANDTVTITNHHQLVYDTTRADICQGHAFTMDSVDYANTGTYTLNTRYYIDSTVYPTLILGVHNNYYSQRVQAICEGEGYAFGGNMLTATGTYTDSLTTAWGCDSTITLNLTVHAHTASQQTEDVCDSYSWHGMVYTASATVTDTIANIHGCDSVCSLNLTVRHSTSGDTTATVCDLFNWYGQNYTVSGTPTHTLTNAAGCDSTLTLTLTVNHSTTGSETVTVCDSMTWHGNLYTTSGTYQDVVTNSVNCDSTVTLNLTVNSSYQHTDAVFSCDNQLPYLYHSQPLSTAGDHTIPFQSVAGCDSIVTVTLTIGTTYQHTDQLALCQSGMPYVYGDHTFMEYDTTGNYTIPFTTEEGCDSIISLDLTVHESEATEIHVVTVQNTNNQVIWEKNAVVDHYNIYRESSTAGVYTLAASIPYSEPSQWLDEESDARVHSYRYRMTAVDSCGVESEQSPIHKTMHLTINQGQGNSWNLVWTEYIGTTYSTYRIYRGSSYDDMQMIGEIPSDNTTFTDNNAPAGNVYYQIVVLLTPQGTKDSYDGTIRSNVATNDLTGIDRIAEGNTNIYQQNGTIVVETVEGLTVQVFDIAGRRLYNVVSTGNDILGVPSTGVYLVRVGNTKARRIVVEK